MAAQRLYVKVLKMAIEPPSKVSIEELCSEIRELRALLSCVVCCELLKDPYEPKGRGCGHYVCRLCMKGRKSLLPDCARCRSCCDFQTYKENRMMALQLGCYQTLCRHLIRSMLFPRLGGPCPVSVVGNEPRIRLPKQSAQWFIEEGANYDDMCNVFLPEPDIDQLSRATSEAEAAATGNLAQFANSSPLIASGARMLNSTPQDLPKLTTGNMDPKELSPNISSAYQLQSDYSNTTYVPSIGQVVQIDSHTPIGTIVASGSSTTEGAFKRRYAEMVADEQVTEELLQPMQSETRQTTYVDPQLGQRSSWVIISSEQVKPLSDNPIVVTNVDDVRVPPAPVASLAETINEVPSFVKVTHAKAKVAPMRSAFQKVKPSSPPPHKCRCGILAPRNPRVTCRNNRCECYANKRKCVGCKCKGCKNPYKATEVTNDKEELVNEEQQPFKTQGETEQHEVILTQEEVVGTTSQLSPEKKVILVPLDSTAQPQEDSVMLQSGNGKPQYFNAFQGDQPIHPSQVPGSFQLVQLPSSGDGNNNSLPKFVYTLLETSVALEPINKFKTPPVLMTTVRNCSMDELVSGNSRGSVSASVAVGGDSDKAAELFEDIMSGTDNL